MGKEGREGCDISNEAVADNVIAFCGVLLARFRNVMERLLIKTTPPVGGANVRQSITQ